jgi:hypothetical protein
MRATGHAVCSSFQRIGGFAAPFLVNSPASLVVVALLLGAGNWMAAVCSYTLPETKGSLLTNMYYLYKCVVYLSVFECRCAYMCVCVAAASIFIHLCTQTHSLTHSLPFHCVADLGLDTFAPRSMSCVSSSEGRSQSDECKKPLLSSSGR